MQPQNQSKRHPPLRPPPPLPLDSDPDHQSKSRGHSIVAIAHFFYFFIFFVPVLSFANQLCSLVKLQKAAIMDIRYPNITIWSVSNLFFIGPIFICSLSFYMKLHYCGLGCLVIFFSICIRCHTIVEMNCCYCEMDFN